MEFFEDFEKDFETIQMYSSDEPFVTNDAGNAYMIKSGSVQVFVAPLNKKTGEPENRIFLCEAEEGSVIPAYAYRDMEYVEWRFVLVPKSDLEMLCLQGKCTSVLRKKFASRTSLNGFEEEGFEQGLAELHRYETLKDKIFIARGKKETLETGQNTGGIIRGVIVGEGPKVIGGSALYKAVANACIETNISIVDTDKAEQLFGEDMTLQDLASVSGFAYREVLLDVDWYKKDCGVLVGKIEDEDVSMIPKGQNSYYIFYGAQDKKEELTKEIAETVNPHAYSLSRNLPSGALKKKDLLDFAKKSVRRADLVMILILALAGAIISALIPTLNQKIYDDFIPMGNKGELIGLCMVIATFMLGNLFFDIVKNIAEDRISSRVGYDLQNAVYYRIFRLPESFMRDFESADMAQRLEFVRSYVDSCVDTVLISGLGAVFALLYLYKMFRYAKKLAFMALLMLVIYTGIVAAISAGTIKYRKKIGEKAGEASSKLYQFINGIEKIRLAGAEDRAAFEYVVPFAVVQDAKTRAGRLQSVISVFSGVASTLFSMVFYIIIVKKSVELSTGNFMAFNSAFGMFSSAMLQLISALINMVQLRPMFDRFKPVIEAAEEDDGSKEAPGEFKGGISLKEVKFSYTQGGPMILNGINLDIKPGEYIGIVGPSGCGKSTLLKLLLGFEKPVSGAVCYDGKDVAQLDKRRLRKSLGVVLQNGQLISGSIYENITITAPTATRKQVEEVIEKVGLKEDIAQMPMGLETVLSENSGTISGGQKQRILIARAIINSPRILIFDEATSALDNLTQAAVSENLDKMNATRIVVAHRLSTIKNCDRIIVFNGGSIIQQGNYETLMRDRNGLFYQLASRQLTD